ncbi:MAG: tripartite tricarboxylate transporter substrate binding protein [Planctomycetota bacterium]|jgi:tripartite-type tricarboxylate transporter receptor subunit TctC|nr:tripartite tricarboxylate transporter substrate binding protein [Planctomycetota bacterium]
MNSIFRKTAMFLLAVFSICQIQAADNYPSKPIQVIIPLNPGGDTDVNGRLFCKYLEEELKQSVVVVNVAGGGGTVGTRRVITSKPDGYTVLFYHTEVFLPKIAGMADFDLFDLDLCGVGILDDTTVLATHNEAPYKTLPELVAYAKANPGKVEFGMMTGGYPHLIGLALANVTGADFNIVDVGGNAAKTVALKGKKTDVINTQYGLTKDYFASGDFVCLGLLSEKRNPLLPSIPTTKELGYPMIFNKFFFFAMPKGAPKPIINAFSAAMKRVTERKDFQDGAANLFITPAYMDPADGLKYAQQVEASFRKYQDIFRAQGGK